MTENGYPEPDVCFICGVKCYVGRTHKEFLEHILQHTVVASNGPNWWPIFRCWCGHETSSVNGATLMKHHLGGVTLDLNMTFYTSVEKLKAHYLASLLGVKP